MKTKCSCLFNSIPASLWASLHNFFLLRLMSGSRQPLKVSQELVKTYTQRRNSHLASATGDGEHSEEPDPYAFVEGDEEFSFTEKKDKLGAEREGNKKYKVGFLTRSRYATGMFAKICIPFPFKIPSQTWDFQHVCACMQRVVYSQEVKVCKRI